ncbi:hypothetical protein BDI4_260122 [Burkholderia diffusa]|nr:hypothetical protein BDI4_260122 [Burkholderia diffusa]
MDRIGVRIRDSAPPADREAGSRDVLARALRSTGARHVRTHPFRRRGPRTHGRRRRQRGNATHRDRARHDPDAAGDVRADPRRQGEERRRARRRAHRRDPGREAHRRPHSAVSSARADARGRRLRTRRRTAGRALRRAGRDVRAHRRRDGSADCRAGRAVDRVRHVQGRGSRDDDHRRERQGETRREVGGLEGGGRGGLSGPGAVGRARYDPRPTVVRLHDVRGLPCQANALTIFEISLKGKFEITAVYLIQLPDSARESVRPSTKKASTGDEFASIEKRAAGRADPGRTTRQAGDAARP